MTFSIVPEKLLLPLSEPFFTNDTNSLVSKLKKLKFDKLKKLMNISNSLTQINLQRFQDFNSDNIGDACDGIGLLEKQNRKKLIKVVDILGRDFSFKTESNFLLYLYDDGSVEKKYKK